MNLLALKDGVTINRRIGLSSQAPRVRAMRNMSRRHLLGGVALLALSVPATKH